MVPLYLQRYNFIVQTRSKSSGKHWHDWAVRAHLRRLYIGSWSTAMKCASLTGCQSLHTKVRKWGNGATLKAAVNMHQIPHPNQSIQQ